MVARLYGPKEFATLEHIAMLLAIIGVTAGGKYEQAILLPKEERKSGELIYLSFRITLVVSAVVLISCFFSTPIANTLNNPELKKAIWLLVPGVLAFSVTNTMTYWLHRNKNFKRSATSKILFSLTGECLKIGLGIFSASGINLALSFIAAHMSTGLYLVMGLKNHPLPAKSDRELRQKVAQEYKAYPLYTLPGNLLNRLAQWVHIALFSGFYGLEMIGFLAISRRLVMNPLSIIAISFSQVYYQKIIEIEDTVELRNHYLQSLKCLSLIAVVIIALVWMLPDNMMSWLFNKKWFSIMTYIRILVFWFAANFTSASLSYIFHRIYRQKLMFQLDILHFTLVTLSIFLARLFDVDALIALKILCASKVLYYSINILVSIWAISSYHRTTL